MSSTAGPDISENGLVLYLDAGNPRSYPGSGTDWADLSGNNNSGSFVGGSIFSTTNCGEFIFDTNNYVQLSSYIKTATNITIGTWFNPQNVNTTQHVWWEGQSGDGFGGQEEIHLTIKTQAPSTFVDNTIGIWGMGTLNLYTPFSSSNIYNNVVVSLQNMSAPNTTVTASLYLNGLYITSSNCIVSRSAYDTALRLGRTTSTVSRKYTGSMAQLSIYDKVLSPQEILQNFNAQRSRFGV